MLFFPFLFLNLQNLGIVHTLVGAQKWKPDREELDKELKKLGLPKEDFKLSKLGDDVLLDPEDPVQNVTVDLFLEKETNLTTLDEAEISAHRELSEAPRYAVLCDKH